MANEETDKCLCRGGGGETLSAGIDWTDNRGRQLFGHVDHVGSVDPWTIIRLSTMPEQSCAACVYRTWNVTRARCRNENRDGAPIRRLKIADRPYSSRSAKCHIVPVYPKSYNSLYYSDECDPVLIDKRLKGLTDAIAQNSTCAARNSIRTVIKSGSRANISGQFRPMRGKLETFPRERSASELNNARLCSR